MHIETLPEFAQPGIDPDNVIIVNDLLEKLSEVDPQLVNLVELKFFVGLSIAEIAEEMNVSMPSVSRQWTLAKSWLAKELAAT